HERAASDDERSPAHRRAVRPGESQVQRDAARCLVGGHAIPRQRRVDARPDARVLDSKQDGGLHHRRIRYDAPGLAGPRRLHQSGATMRNSGPLAWALLAAFGAVGPRPTAGVAVPAPNDATVISLSVVPRTGRADVVVRVEGPVSFKHFTLAKPDKIVVDLSGATLGLPDGDAYDGVSRGGITRIRYSQFTRTVVRVVLTLDAPHAYTLTNDRGALHISIDGAADAFQPWAIGDANGERKAPDQTETLAKVEAPKHEADAPKHEADAPKPHDVEAPAPAPAPVFTTPASP